MNNKKKPVKFKELDYIIITKKPIKWSDILNKKSPILNRIVYPYHCQIQKIVWYEDTKHYAMTDGEYGWSLSSLVFENKIIPDNVKLRKEKLKNINNAQHRIRIT